MKILIGCLYFSEFTGSELYVYELAKGLKKKNYDVSIVSTLVGGPITQKAIELGIKVYNFSTLPKNEKFDLIHCQHVPITQELIKLYPTIKKICTLHSEVNALENPVNHFSIFKYIVIRPEIGQRAVSKFDINPDSIELIFNPIDETRFNKSNTRDDGYILFVGTLDYLREKTLFDLVNHAENNKKELWIVGQNKSNYLPLLLSNKHVKYFNETDNVEKFVKNCSETAGVLMGRTTIEGWMCGKPGWIYNITADGKYNGKSLILPPNDIEKFYATNVINQINQEYKKILK
jgi:glycosyltransferase involved in cell wall biosynthesis